MGIKNVTSLILFLQLAETIKNMDWQFTEFANDYKTYLKNKVRVHKNQYV